MREMTPLLKESDSFNEVVDIIHHERYLLCGQGDAIGDAECRIQT